MKDREFGSENFLIASTPRYLVIDDVCVIGVRI